MSRLWGYSGNESKCKTVEWQFWSFHHLPFHDVLLERENRNWETDSKIPKQNRLQQCKHLHSTPRPHVFTRNYWLHFYNCKVRGCQKWSAQYVLLFWTPSTTKFWRLFGHIFKQLMIPLMPTGSLLKSLFFLFFLQGPAHSGDWAVLCYNDDEQAHLSLYTGTWGT